MSKARILGLCLIALATTVFVAACAKKPAAPASGVERMYVFDCGENQANDVSPWLPGVAAGTAGEFSIHCYLIRHSAGLMLWDAGLADSIADSPDGVTRGQGAIRSIVRKTLASQLAEIGVKPEEVTHIAFSHMHADHVGNANAFTRARLYIQETEYEAAFGPNASKFGFDPSNYDRLRSDVVLKLNGDYDVFGDGSVTILSTPGHTPGHQSLLVRLPQRGAVLLSGDVAHSADNWVNRRVPVYNFSQEQSRQSMEKITELVKVNKAQLWINHDKTQNASIPKSPAYVE